MCCGCHEMWHVVAAHTRARSASEGGQLCCLPSSYELLPRRGLFGNSDQVQKDRKEEELRLSLEDIWFLEGKKSYLSFMLNSIFQE